MNFSRKLSVLVFILVMLGGCAGVNFPKDGEQSKAHEAKLPFAEPEPSYVELDEESVFSMLTAEIAAHRAKLELAQNHYLYVARLTGSAYASKRAALIALFQGEKEKLLDAATLWVKMAPNDISARKTLALAYLQQGKNELAYTQLQALIKVAEAKDSDGYLLIASAFSKQVNKKSGLALLQRLVAENQRPVKGEYAIALLAYAVKDFELANEKASLVFNQQPKNARAALLLSQILVAKNDIGEAESVLKKSVERHPSSAVLRTAYAKLLTDADKLDEARDQFIALLKLQPDDTDVQYAIAILAIQSKDWDEAEKYLTLIHDKGQRRDEMAYYLGHVSEFRGNKKLAIAWYESIGNSEYRPDSQIRLARIYAQMGRMDDALDLLAIFRSESPARVLEGRLLEVELLRESGQKKKAIALLDEQIKQAPDSIKFRYLRGMIFAELSMLEQMEEDFEFILKRRPDDVDTLNAYGYTLADKTDRIEEAYEYVSKAYQLEPDSAAVMDSMGWVFFRMGRYDEAIALLRQAFDKLPDGEIAAHLGEALWVSGERKKAVQLWDNVLKNEPENQYVKDAKKRFQ